MKKIDTTRLILYIMIASLSFIATVGVIVMLSLKLINLEAIPMFFSSITGFIISIIKVVLQKKAMNTSYKQKIYKQFNDNSNR